MLIATQTATLMHQREEQEQKQQSEHINRVSYVPMWPQHKAEVQSTRVDGMTGQVWCRAASKGDLTERAKSVNLDYVQALTGPALMVRLNSLHYVQTNTPQLVQIVQDRHAPPRAGSLHVSVSLRDWSHSM